MKFRWTIKQLDKATDLEILRSLVAERKSELNVYSFFTNRLRLIYDQLDNLIDQGRKELL
jgi:hypothetical protein